MPTVAQVLNETQPLSAVRQINGTLTGLNGSEATVRTSAGHAIKARFLEPQPTVGSQVLVLVFGTGGACVMGNFGSTNSNQEVTQ